MSRQYVATLALIAALVLASGLVARRVLESHDAADLAPPSEAAPLQQLAQEGVMRRTAAYVAERVAAVAGYVEFVPASGASGVRWGRDSLLTVDRGRRVRAVALARDTARSAVPLAPDTTRREWLLVVGRDSSGRVLSTTTLAGGRTRMRCGDRVVETFVVGARLDEQLAGAGVFTVDGALLGMAAWCDGQLAAIPVRDLRLLLAAHDAPTRVESPAGFSVSVGDSLARMFAGTDTALLVTAVRRGSRAAALGVRVGDLVVSVNGRAIRADSARRVLGDASLESLVVARRRGGRWTATTLVAPSDARVSADPFGLRTAPVDRGVPVTLVAPGSVAERAGLRVGDRLIRVADATVTSSATAARLLAAAASASSNAPVLVTFERDGVERAALLNTPPSPAAVRTP